MRIVAVIPDAAWRHTAGVRIRYDRLMPELAALGHRLDLTPIDDFHAGRGFDADVYLFCKTYDARAPLLAREMQAAGARVGVDFFDDYFSQTGDSRFVHLRRWYRSMMRRVDFALCATPQMHERLSPMAGSVPFHVVNDPSGPVDPAAIAETARRNAARARQSRCLDLGWFGIGDNPYFQVGLSDLHAFGAVLTGVRALGYDARLRVLTNERSLTVNRLEMLARLPVPVRMDLWSEAAEAALIAGSLACFLPVNAQGFSTVKSLNRGVTTLSGGAQILSAGYPLYDRLGAFVYRDPAALVSDLETDRLKLRPDTVAGLADLLAEAGNARAGAAALAEFLTHLPAPSKPAPGPVAVLHGISTPDAVATEARRLGHLSVAVPGAAPSPTFDLDLETDADGAPVAILSARARELLRDGLGDRATAGTGRDGTPRFRLPLDGLVAPETLRRILAAGGADGSGPGRFARIAFYGPGLSRMQRLLDVLFDTSEILLSEMAVPFLGPPALERIVAEPVPNAEV